MERLPSHLTVSVDRCHAGGRGEMPMFMELRHAGGEGGWAIALRTGQ